MFLARCSFFWVLSAIRRRSQRGSMLAAAMRGREPVGWQIVPVFHKALCGLSVVLPGLRERLFSGMLAVPALSSFWTIMRIVYKAPPAIPMRVLQAVFHFSCRSAIFCLVLAGYGTAGKTIGFHAGAVPSENAFQPCAFRAISPPSLVIRAVPSFSSVIYPMTLMEDICEIASCWVSGTVKSSS